jgi:hypothetical protein
MPDRRELYRSPNGDTWFLGREPTSGHAFIIHQPNGISGPNTHQQAMARMISPRLPRISPENSGMQFLVAELATL